MYYFSLLCHSFVTFNGIDARLPYSPGRRAGFGGGGVGRSPGSPPRYPGTPAPYIPGPFGGGANMMTPVGGMVTTRTRTSPNQWDSQHTLDPRYVTCFRDIPVKVSRRGGGLTIEDESSDLASADAAQRVFIFFYFVAHIVMYINSPWLMIEL
jgi:hypothetical protein